jgi:hypothetical protein
VRMVEQQWCAELVQQTGRFARHLGVRAHWAVASGSVPPVSEPAGLS